MQVAGSVCVITGAAGGIGSALARRFAQERPAGLVLTDLPGTALDDVAAEVGAVAVAGDVGDEDLHRQLVAVAEERFGPVDLYCSNAGTGAPGGLHASLDDWDRVWKVNTLAHVLAARAVLPSMLERGRGWLLQTASAAGLLINLGEPAYTATKHAAVGFAEWLSATYRHRGIGVSCLCPMGVDTAMLRTATDDGVAGNVVRGAGEVLAPEVVADVVVQGLAVESFLILPHPEVSRFWQGQAGDPDRWLEAMNRVQQKLEG
jgi:NAD(P)-dependent dehydrogenase (short-subunit alcohol dehydrogenase family)